MTKPLVWSYSFISTYLNCPRMAHAKYVSKEVPYVETEQMRWGNKVHKAFEQRLNDKRPLTQDLMQWEPLCTQLEMTPVKAEVKMGVSALGAPEEFFGHHVWGRGVVDVLKVQDDKAWIGDWKTGKVREDPLELEIFGLFIRVHNPHITKVTGNYIWMQENRLGEQHDVSDHKRTWAFIQKISADIDTLKKHLGDKPWPEKQNGLCKQWCDVVSCQFNGRRK